HLRIVGKSEVIRFISHAARWRHFFRCSLAAPNSDPGRDESLLMPGEPVLRRCQRHARPPSCSADKKWNIPQQKPPSCKQNLPQSDKRGWEPPGADSDCGQDFPFELEA